MLFQLLSTAAIHLLYLPTFQNLYYPNWILCCHNGFWILCKFRLSPIVIFLSFWVEDFLLFFPLLGFWVSVLLSASVERCFVSRVRDFYVWVRNWQSGNDKNKQKNSYFYSKLYLSNKTFPKSSLAPIIPTSSIIFISNVCIVHLDFSWQDNKGLKRSHLCTKYWWPPVWNFLSLS